MPFWAIAICPYRLGVSGWIWVAYRWLDGDENYRSVLAIVLTTVSLFQ